MEENSGVERTEEHEDQGIPEDLLEFKRRIEALGGAVQLPRPGAKWIEPEPLPIDANVASRFVVWLRRKDRL